MKPIENTVERSAFFVVVVVPANMLKRTFHCTLVRCGFLAFWSAKRRGIGVGVDGGVSSGVECGLRKGFGDALGVTFRGAGAATADGPVGEVAEASSEES